MKNTLTALVLLGLTSLSPVAHATVLYQLDNITTGVGDGFSGADTSTIQAGGTTYGSTVNSTSGVASTSYWLAEDFVLSQTSSVATITFDAYSTSTYPDPPSTSPFTGATLQIWDAQPGSVGASVLHTSTSIVSSFWTEVYRVASTTLTNANRPVFTVGMGFSNITLGPGTYWAAYTVTSVGAPGVASSVFSSPAMDFATGNNIVGNALQMRVDQGTWNPALDSALGTQITLPLKVESAAVPEAGSMAALFACGALACVAYRRRARRVALAGAAGPSIR